MTYAELRGGDFAFGTKCDPPAGLVGGFVAGPLHADRRLVFAEPHYRAFHELDDPDADGQAFGTVYQYPHAEYAAHLRAAGSPRGYAGPAACSRVVWDIDRPDPAAALADARTLLRALRDRYGGYAEAGAGVYFSGSKGYHVSLVATPGFTPLPHVPAVVKLLAMTVARAAGVAADPAVYDRQRLFRLPNSRHAGSGLYKRFLTAEELFALNPARVRAAAAHPAGHAVPAVTAESEQLVADWLETEAKVLAAAPTGVGPGGHRSHPSSSPVVPKFVRDFIGFADVQDPGRAVTLFRCAASLAEAGTPERVVAGLLEEPAVKTGLDPAEVRRQIAAGVTHGRRGAP